MYPPAAIATRMTAAIKTFFAPPDLAESAVSIENEGVLPIVPESCLSGRSKCGADVSSSGALFSGVGKSFTLAGATAAPCPVAAPTPGAGVVATGAGHAGCETGLTSGTALAAGTSAATGFAGVSDDK